MSFDDQYLFTVSEDACLFIFKAVDKEGRGMKRDKEVGYAEEILITKSDLEEKVRTKTEICEPFLVFQGHFHSARFADISFLNGHKSKREKKHYFSIV